MVRLFRVFIPVGVVVLLVSELALIVGAYILAACFNPQSPVVDYLVEGNGVLNIALVLATIAVGLYLQDLYTDIYVKSHVVLLQQLCFIIGAAFLVQGMVSYVDRSLRMPLHVMVPGSAMALVGIYGWRVFFSSYVLRVVSADSLLLVGNSPLLADIAHYIAAHPEKGLKVVGCVSDDAEDLQAPETAKVLGRIEYLREIVNATHPTRIVVGMRERRNRLPVADLLELRYGGHLIEEAPTAFERVCGRICTKELRPSQLIYSGEFSRHRNTVFYQTLGNLIIASVGMVVAVPLMAITALAVRFSSPGPVLYRQTRIGMDGAPFRLYKFRSMRADAEDGTGAVWARRNDPRVTAVGRIIRKIRFDELPQLFNVLKGEMSIVGPRPERPEFVKMLAEKIPYYRQRHAVRPGITGWAQINYKYGDTMEDSITKLEYDLYYIKHMSWALDFYIIFHTVKAMLLSRGAQ
jgi:sugar transferase (PEP-CTERM system associated)